MSTESTLPAASVEPSPPVASPIWERLDNLLERWGEKLNPILVKETRQALKSKQFTITFGLLLLAGWAWSFLGAVFIGSSIYYGSHGGQMFVGYFLILAVPLLVIVPFSAFRSLASEREDGTYELLSITSLGPRQIISGKLGSSIVQMLIYGSAISPCLAFTYMLRGIDMPTIITIMVFMFLSSLLLSLVGLLCATATSERHWQVVLSVLLVMFLMVVCFGLISIAIAALDEGAFQFDNRYFWLTCGAIITAYVGYFSMIFLAASAQLTFVSDNRSTGLRITMMLQYFLFSCWMGWLWLYEGDRLEPQVPVATIIFVMLHWFLMGAFMTGEHPDLSLRVRRNLPQTFLGRILFTWFSPGPGTGYMYAVTSVFGAVLMWLPALIIGGQLVPNSSNYWDEAPFVMSSICLLGTSYVVFYLGLGALLVRLLRKVNYVPLMLTVLIQFLLVMMGIVVPIVVQFMIDDFGSRFSYTLLQIPSPIWTIAAVFDQASSGPTWELVVAMVVVPFGALCIFLLNLPAIADEVRRIRIAAPQRVAEDDAAQAALPAQPVPFVPTNPWDSPPPAPNSPPTEPLGETT